MKKRVLIADDEPAIQRLVARALGEESFEILTASDGERALAIASQEQPDLILLDLGMPKRDGWRVLKDLRTSVRTRITPVILLTGLMGLSDEVFGLEAGADDYVTKPFVASELRARVSSLLRRNQLGLSANPLTKLPGSPAIEEEVNRRIAAGVGFAFHYVDINHFKPYNDIYGFAAGDKVICATARILMEAVGEHDAEGFVGHVGGDDFVAITGIENAGLIADRIAARFDESRAAFYSAEDLAAGFVETQDRQGVLRRMPTISLSIGIATNSRRVLDHYAKVVQIAAEMKAYCKGQGAGPSRFAFDRRQDMEAA